MTRLSTLILGLCLTLGAPVLAAGPRGVLYEFGAKWCGPCQEVAPVVEKLEREGLPIRKIDIDEKRNLANEYRIERIPTFVLVIDGQEADRHIGSLTEADMRRLIASIPADGPEIVNPSGRAPAGDGRMNVPVQLGEPAPMMRPTPLPGYSEETRVAQEEPKRGLRDLWPFGRKERTSEEPSVIRGNDEPTQTAAAPGSLMPEIPQPGNPMQASARIRVIHPDSIHLGSGTVISSSAGVTQILTCEHIFKDFKPDTKIEVDLFVNGRPTQYVGRLVHADRESDLGLISVPTAEPVAVCPIANREEAPNTGEPVVAIGCSGGEEPTQQQLQVTDIDKYDGPHNLLCTGLPVSGRSGGGLFNANGQIVGVCSAADKEAGRGFYSGLFAIHKLLDDCSLTALYNPPSPAQEPETRLAAESGAPTVPETLNASGSIPPVDVQAGNAEVVVVIRDRTQPQAPNRIIIFHSPSPKFYSYLKGEVDNGGLNGVLGQSQPAPAQTMTAPGSFSTPEPSSRQATAELAAGHQRTKEVLEPTAYSRPIAQRYVRTRN